MEINSNILLTAVPGFLILVIVETLHMNKENREHNFKTDIAGSLGIGVGAGLVSFFTTGLTVFVYSFIYQHRLFNLPASAWWVWAACFIGDDFSYYWYHRMSHQIRFFWASHVVHHSSQLFTFSASLRVPWTSNLTGTFLFWAWLPLIGIHPGMIILMKSVSAIYQFVLHTESVKRLPKWFEYVFNTPSHHRVHHASDVDYLDKNHAGTFILWDRMFGTFREETNQPVYGLTTNVNSANPIKIAFFEWKNIIDDLKHAHSLKESVNLVFNAPGWSKDGSTKTTRQLQQHPNSCYHFN
ncbi:MAG: sterol desaturase family protein [Chitinophagaceae bacterium]|nr:sterol desaturase family protein [Chitinophagaceae bacterium]